MRGKSEEAGRRAWRIFERRPSMLCPLVCVLAVCVCVCVDWPRLVCVSCVRVCVASVGDRGATDSYMYLFLFQQLVSRLVLYS